MMQTMIAVFQRHAVIQCHDQLKLLVDRGVLQTDTMPCAIASDSVHDPYILSGTVQAPWVKALQELGGNRAALNRMASARCGTG